MDGWGEVTGTIRVYVNEPVYGFEVGDGIQAYCWLSRFAKVSNPGQFDIAGYLALKNVYVGASINSRDAITKLEAGSGSWFSRSRISLRKFVSGVVFDSSIEEAEEKGLLEALLLGQRGNIERSVYGAFRKTNLLHFISLSGMHLGILVAVVWWLSRLAGLLKRGRAIVCMVVVVLFLMVVPARAPTLRAAIICIFFCLAMMFRRNPNGLNTLSLAAMVLLLINPKWIFEAGWQLSFASVSGILIFTSNINGWLQHHLVEKVTWFFKEMDSRFRGNDKSGGNGNSVGKDKWNGNNNGLLTPIISFVISVFAVGFSAWLGGAGVLLYHFNSINPLTCFYTVIAFPLVAGILSVGLGKVIISLLFPTAGVLLGVV